VNTTTQHRISPLAILVYTLAAAFLCYEMALQASPSVMTTELMRDMHIDAAGLGLMAGCYFYSYTLMQIPAGLLFDRFSARWLITGALLVCVAGALFFGSTHTVEFAALGRFFMGFGSAFAFIGVLVIASHWFSAGYFAFLVGIAQLLAAMGAAGGEVPLSISVTRIGWRGTIHGIAVAGLVLAVLIALIVRDYPSWKKPTLAKRKSYGVMTSLRFITTSSQSWWVALYAFTSWAPVAVFAELWGVPYLQSAYHIGSTYSAVAVAMLWAGIGLTAPVLGWFSDHLGRRRVLLSSCSAIGLIATLAILYVPHMPMPLLFLLLFGFGIAGAGQILSFAVVKDNNRPSVTATAIGFNNMAVVAGGAMFQPFAGLMLRQHWGGQMLQGVPVYTSDNYRLALGLVPICYGVGLIVSRFFIKETFCKAKYTEDEA